MTKTSPIQNPKSKIQNPHNPCGTCGACCRSYVVPACGHDVWDIVTHQRIGPEHFLLAYPQDEVSIDGFRLDKEGKPYGLALDKRGSGPFALDKPCVFLVRLGDGHERCGIYDHRPVTCAAYPMALWDRTTFLRKDALCPPNSWSLSELKRPSWTLALQRFHMHHDIYREVIARWNAHVTASAERRFGFSDYFDYLMNVYDRLAALDADLGEAAQRDVESTWPTLPRSSLDVDEVRVRVGELPWLDYLSRARQAIDTFFPEMPPLPLLVLDPIHWPEAFGAPNAKSAAQPVGTLEG
jgi:Fe-S-cluster containining protein